MKITVNGNTREVENVALPDLLEELGHGPDATIATALNGDFVPVSTRGETVLKEGDKLEILAPMKGG